jgi:hypothetical protein
MNRGACLACRIARRLSSLTIFHATFQPSSSPTIACNLFRSSGCESPPIASSGALPFGRGPWSSRRSQKLTASRGSMPAAASSRRETRSASSSNSGRRGQVCLLLLTDDALLDWQAEQSSNGAAPSCSNLNSSVFDASVKKGPKAAVIGHVRVRRTAKRAA